MIPFLFFFFFFWWVVYGGVDFYLLTVEQLLLIFCPYSFQLPLLKLKDMAPRGKFSKPARGGMWLSLSLSWSCFWLLWCLGKGENIYKETFSNYQNNRWKTLQP